MRAAVERYATYRERPEAWALGRFVVPLSRLEEFVAEREAIGRAGDPWRLSVLIAGEPHAEAACVLAFNGRHAERARIEGVEAKVGSGPTGLRALAALEAAPWEGVERYAEVSLDGDVEALVRAMAGTGLATKIRTGGVTPESFPSAGAVARVLVECARLRVPVKATAGLHHPVRSTYRLTYEPDSEMGKMFGFLNVLIGAAAAYHGAPLEEVVAILETEGAGAAAGDFQFENDGARWRERTWSTRALTEARSSFVRSFGSCSFEEPMRELRELELL